MSNTQDSEEPVNVVFLHQDHYALHFHNNMVASVWRFLSYFTVTLLLDGRKWLRYLDAPCIVLVYVMCDTQENNTT